MNKVQITVIAVVVLLLILLVVFRGKITALFAPKAQKVFNVSTKTTTAEEAQGLDYDKVLKRGLNNSEEVQVMQYNIGGIDADGDFGPLTEARLVEFAGVKQITLNQLANFMAQKDLPVIDSTGLVRNPDGTYTQGADQVTSSNTNNFFQSPINWLSWV